MDGLCLVQGKRQDKVVTVRCIVHGELSAVQFGKRACQSQSDAGSRHLVGTVSLILYKGLEYFLAHGKRDNLTVVRDGKL